jgi:hypothetical protein
MGCFTCVLVYFCFLFSISFLVVVHSDGLAELAVLVWLVCFVGSTSGWLGGVAEAVALLAVLQSVLRWSG